MVLMLQKEVAERLTAGPGSKLYGALSVAVQYRCRAEYLFDVSANVFLPRPKVDSGVIKLVPDDTIYDKPSDEKLFFALIRAGFGKRRKMLRGSLLTAVPDRKILADALEQTGIDGTLRAENLTAGDFIRLADALTGPTAQ
jgi:16S rRNA (adenine1518-N6/adenine1519-N6)-dimethyltransferase